jgi:hypothetical protein
VSPGVSRDGWPLRTFISVVLSRLRKMSYEHAMGPRLRSVRGQFTRPGCLSFVISALYGECCVGIASSFQRHLSANGSGQARKNAEFILDEDLAHNNSASSGGPRCTSKRHRHQTLLRRAPVWRLARVFRSFPIIAASRGSDSRSVGNEPKDACVADCDGGGVWPRRNRNRISSWGVECCC